MIGATKAPRKSDINFRVGSMVYSSRNKQSGIVVTRDEYGRNKMINNAQTPVYFPKGKKVVAVYNRYLQSLDDKISGIGNVSKELKYIYKASDCSDKSDCRIAIDQVNELKKRFGYTPAIRARLRSLENRLKDF